ncbi:Uncharacterised protein [Serratia fonticola]|uniref:Uncharacterized protein n=1 Tax=Serratia fonticola TaxID=47917 RepID=A0A4U9W4P1_SERFO|nr:Uncharacterised protein [Serratia fonticola]
MIIQEVVAQRKQVNKAFIGENKLPKGSAGATWI